MKRYKPPGEVRAFGDQLEERCEERGLLKQEVAAKAKISPAQLSHYIKFGCSIPMIERISEALGVDPSYFDVYVVENSAHLIAANPDLLNFMRALGEAPSEPKKRALLGRLR